MLRRADEAVPVGLDVFGRAANLRDDLGHLLSRHHLDGVPRAYRQIVGVGLFARDVNANFATHAPLQVDLAEALQVLKRVVLLDFDDAIDGTDFDAGFAARAVVCVDHRQFFGKLFSRPLFGHRWSPSQCERGGRRHGAATMRLSAEQPLMIGANRPAAKGFVVGLFSRPAGGSYTWAVLRVQGSGFRTRKRSSGLSSF